MPGILALGNMRLENGSNANGSLGCVARVRPAWSMEEMSGKKGRKERGRKKARKKELKKKERKAERNIYKYRTGISEFIRQSQ